MCNIQIINSQEDEAKTIKDFFLEKIENHDDLKTQKLISDLINSMSNIEIKHAYSDIKNNQQNFLSEISKKLSKYPFGIKILQEKKQKQSTKAFIQSQKQNVDFEERAQEQNNITVQNNNSNNDIDEYIEDEHEYDFFTSEEEGDIDEAYNIF